MSPIGRAEIRALRASIWPMRGNGAPNAPEASTDMNVKTLTRPAVVEPRPVRHEEKAATGERRPSRKWTASIISVVLMATVLAPVLENWREDPRDDFPLSYYPMFSFEKSDRQRVTYLVAHDSRGSRLLIPYQYAGQGGMNQVRRQMNKLVDRGQASRLCRNVAARVARSGDLPKDLVSIQVVTGTFLMTEFFSGNRTPRSESVRAHCPVRGE
jgi:hypothetical protein